MARALLAALLLVPVVASVAPGSGVTTTSGKGAHVPLEPLEPTFDAQSCNGSNVRQDSGLVLCWAG